ncbi:MAG: hypothetical protein KatS3mg009_0372 [Acidimicrobiia bacterium]|nr:MAG: hypothetical protein KatS3mg009_0372 [Acidimicrobiia bacterium]
MRSATARRTALAVALTAVVAGALAVAGVPPTRPGPAGAATWTEGACAGTEGVTVVVDASALGGPLTVRCALGTPASGWAALEAAGHVLTSVPGFPGAAVCTIDGRPASGFPACWETGFWSYWHAPSTAPGSAWTFSTVGASARVPPPGSAEGWAFATGPATPPAAGPAFATTTTTATTAPPTTAPPTSGPATTATTATTAPASTTTTVAAPTTTTVPAPGPGTPAARALAWLGAELGRHGGLLPGPFGGTPDHGLTADALVALALGGRAGPADAAPLLAAAADYVTWDAFGPDLAGVRLAGPAAKLLLVAALAGSPPPTVGGEDLETLLRSLVRTGGEEAGRVSDRNPHAPDSSNGFGQALAVLALDHTAGGPPSSAVRYLLAQQCPNGGFRLFLAGPRCTDDAQADPDTTALAVQALLGAPTGPDVRAAAARGVAYLLDRQDASGAVGGSGPTAAPNANSTGLAGQALRAAGETAAAERAAAWVGALQLPTDAGPAAADAGAIAYDPAALADALANGIPGPGRDQWRRATAQAVLALGLPPLAPVVAGPADPPAQPGGTTTPAPGPGPTAGATTPATQVGAATAGTGGGALPRTGPALGAVVVVGAGALAAGLALAPAARRRR